MNKYRRCIGYVFLLSFGLSMEMAATARPQLHALGAGGYSGKGRRVAVAGNYAYLAGDDTGLHVVDVRDPAHCVRVGGYNNTNGFAFGVAAAGKYVYLANDVAGLEIIDVSNPANCVRVGGYHTLWQARGVAVAGHYAYLAVASGGFQVIDVRDPTNCVSVGGVPGDYAGDVVVAGNYAYVATEFAGLQIMDVSDPTNCVRVGGYDTLPTTRGVAVAGNYAYLADSDGAFQVIDVSDPANCVWVGGFTDSRTLYAEGVAVAGNYAYVADADEGLQVIDVSDPSNCMWVSGWSIGTNIATGVTVVGGRIYVAHRGGLLVLPSLPNVQLTVRVDAVPGVNFTIQTATNLSEPITWTSVLTTNVATMPFDFVDYDVKTAEQPQKFYRVRQP
jgi:hypothetical protein